MKKGRVIITCKKHGDFLQKPSNHIFGQGCPICKESKLENEIRNLLVKHGIEFEEQYSPSWLERLRLDFYLKDYNIAIECQGKQHFLSDCGWNKGDFEKIVERDKRKKKLCDEHGIKLLYYSNLGIEYPYAVIEQKEEILKIMLS